MSGLVSIRKKIQERRRKNPLDAVLKPGENTDPFVPLTLKEQDVLNKSLKWTFAATKRVFSETLYNTFVCSTGLWGGIGLLSPLPSNKIIALSVATIGFLAAANNTCKERKAIKASAYLMQDEYLKRPLAAVGGLLPQIAYDNEKKERVEEVVLSSQDQGFLNKIGYDRTMFSAAGVITSGLGSILIDSFSEGIGLTSSFPERLVLPLGWTLYCFVGFKAMAHQYKNESARILENNFRPVGPVLDGGLLPAVPKDELEGRIRETRRVRAIYDSPAIQDFVPA